MCTTPLCQTEADNYIFLQDLGLTGENRNMTQVPLGTAIYRNPEQALAASKGLILGSPCMGCTSGRAVPGSKAVTGGFVSIANCSRLPVSAKKPEAIVV